MKDSRSRTGVSMCEIVFSYMRCSLLTSDTVYSELMMDVVSRF
jgi:hypothetical protein